MTRPLPPDAETLLQHRDFLRALARNLLADEQLAEDVVQESFVMALTRPPRAAESLRSWLARVVERSASNLRRGEARRRWREGVAARGEAAPSSAEVSESLFLQRRVLATLDALHEPYKTAIFLRWYEGLPPREIARRLDVPVETVRSRIKRGLARLRAELDEEFGERKAWALPLWPLARPEPSVLWSSGALLTAALGLVAVLSLALFPGLRSAVRSIGGEPPATPDLAPQPAPPGSSPRQLGEPLAVDRGREAARVERVAAPPEPEEESPARDATSSSPALLPGGPSYELDLDTPPALDLDELRARLLWFNDGGRVRTSAAVALRAGPLPWVSFAAPPPPSLTSRGGRSMYLLRVESVDGRWGAAARVHAIGGRYPVAVPLRLEARGTLTLLVLDPNGAPIEGAEVRARNADRRESTRRAESGPAGEYRLLALEPGAWTVSVDSRFHEVLTRELEVAGGEDRELELYLSTRPMMRIRGRLGSRTGAPLSESTLRLRSSTRPGQGFVAATEPDPERPGTLQFDFGEVPLDEYVLLPPEESPFDWIPPLRRLQGSELTANFECADGGPTRAIRFRAFDRDTGERLERFATTLLVDRYGLGLHHGAELEMPFEPRATSFDEAPWGAAAADLPLYWLVECAGYQAQQGDDTALVRRGDEWVLELQLAPAWRRTFWTGTIDEEGRRQPLAGARLLTHAGGELGRSLGDGFLRLDITYDPGVLDFRLDGWRLAEWTGFDGGLPTAELEVYEVWFERRE